MFTKKFRTLDPHPPTVSLRTESDVISSECTLSIQITHAYRTLSLNTCQLFQEDHLTKVKSDKFIFIIGERKTSNNRSIENRKGFLTTMIRAEGRGCIRFLLLANFHAFVKLGLLEAPQDDGNRATLRHLFSLQFLRTLVYN